MALNADDIQLIMKAFEAYGWDEMRLEIGPDRLVIHRNASDRSCVVETSVGQPEVDGAQRPAAKPEMSPAVAAPRATVVSDDALLIRAPTLGTFWRQPKPGAETYVEIDDLVDEQTTVCLIEVMKLFTPLNATVEGRIAEILVDDGDMIEYGTPLFRVEPVQ